MDEVGCLTITRRAGEALVIGGNVEVVIAEVDRGRVRVSIKAPKSVKVFRKELLTRLLTRENKHASDSASSGDPQRSQAPGAPGGSD